MTIKKNTAKNTPVKVYIKDVILSLDHGKRGFGVVGVVKLWLSGKAKICQNQSKEH